MNKYSRGRIKVKQKTLVAGKEYVCAHCNNKINVGDKMVRVIVNGINWCSHLSCQNQ